ncbi:MAG: hypothetical protein WBD01_10285 [Salaquimonas sp.]
MRFIIVLLSLLLVSCATPKTEPQSFYSGVYVPGKVEISSNGSFTSTASVISGDNLPTARKAAYARFLLAAKNKGYKYFELGAEKTTTTIGRTFKLTGRALNSKNYNGRTYRVSDIKDLLKGGKLTAIKRPPPPKKVVVAAKPRPAVKNVIQPIPVSVPVSQPVSVPEVTPVDEPTVIMAPTDITGSISKSRANVQTREALSTSTFMEIDVPNAVADLPQGVLLRRN